MKKGYKSTEFWLSTTAMLLGQLMVSGVLTDGSTAAQIVGGAMTLLSALGYTHCRTSLKKEL